MIKSRKAPYLFDIRVKYILGEPVELLQMPTPVFNPDSVETLDEWVTRHRDYDDDRESDPVISSDRDNVSARSASRAKSKIVDIIRCNPDMNYFVTLTLSQEQIDRYDYSAVIKKLNSWLDNRVRRNGLKYLLVPEYHKDGAIHFHGVINDSLPLDFSGRYLRNGKAVQSRTGKKIYNLADYPYGFTTAIKITGKDGNAAVAGYVRKYITKDFRKVGGRYYLHGGALAAPEYQYLRLSDYTVDIAALPCTVEYEIFKGNTARLSYRDDILTFLGLLNSEEKNGS